MRTLKERNMDKVLKQLIDMPKNIAGYIYEPVGFKNMFPYVTDEALKIILDSLENQHFISIDYIDKPECFNIQVLEVTSDGFSYFMHQEHISKKELVRFLIPLIISVIALIKSFQPEITALAKLLMRLLKQS